MFVVVAVDVLPSRAYAPARPCPRGSYFVLASCTRVLVDAWNVVPTGTIQASELTFPWLSNKVGECRLAEGYMKDGVNLILSGRRNPVTADEEVRDQE